MPVTTRSMTKKQQKILNYSIEKNDKTLKYYTYYKYNKSLIDNSDISSGGVYIATSEEGDVFRIVFTEENEKYKSDPVYKTMKGLECYDENYIRYIYYSDIVNLKTCLFGTLYTKYDDGEECFWNVTLKKEMEPIIVDNFNHLFVYNSKINDYVDWRSLVNPSEFESMTNIYFKLSYDYNINILNLKKNAKTGNYKILIKIENNINNEYDYYYYNDNYNYDDYDNYIYDNVYFNILLSPNGKILKKCIDERTFY